MHRCQTKHGNSDGRFWRFFQQQLTDACTNACTTLSRCRSWTEISRSTSSPQFTHTLYIYICICESRPLSGPNVWKHLFQQLVFGPGQTHTFFKPGTSHIRNAHCLSTPRPNNHCFENKRLAYTKRSFLSRCKCGVKR